MRNCFVVIFSIIFYLCKSQPLNSARQSLEEVAGFFEGDMNLSNQQLRDIFMNPNAGVLDSRRRWNRDSITRNVIVPFQIRARSPYTQTQHNIIRAAMDEIERNSCIRFVQRTNQQDFIEIFSGNGCWSHVGRNGGMQELSLAHSSSATCVTNGIVMHELLHALGFYHMQSSSNRDNFVRINWENIQPGMEHNFLKYDHNTVGLFNTNYDFDSVLHYSRTAFSRNGRDTITTLSSQNNGRIGQRMRMSNGDFTRLRNMYNCST